MGKKKHIEQNDNDVLKREEMLEFSKKVDLLVPRSGLEKSCALFLLFLVLLFIITLIFGWFLFSRIGSVLITLLVLVVIIFLTFFTANGLFRERMRRALSMTDTEKEIALARRNLQDQLKLEAKKLEMSDQESSLTKKEKQEKLHMKQLSQLQEVRKKRLMQMPHILEYKQARRIHEEIQNAMISFYEKGNFKQQLDSSASKLSNNFELYGKIEFLDCEFDLDTDLGIKAFLDMMIYKTASDCSCIAEVFINRKRYRRPEKVEFLQAMLESTIGLFQIVEVDIEMAFVTLEHVFTSKKYKIIDLGVSATPQSVSHYVYTRIIDYGDVSFGTGFAMMFKKTDKFIRKFIASEKDNFTTDNELVRMIKLYQHSISSKNKAKINIISPF